MTKLNKGEITALTEEIIFQLNAPLKEEKNKQSNLNDKDWKNSKEYKIFMGLVDTIKTNKDSYNQSTVNSFESLLKSSVIQKEEITLYSTWSSSDTYKNLFSCL